MRRPLEGRRVLVTRETPGELASLLEERGATVLHLPLIAVAEPADGGRALREALAGLSEFDWLIVTSPVGAERAGAAAASAPNVRLAAVGRATARVLEEISGRPVDIVPDVQLAEALASSFVARVPSPRRILIAQADIAPPTLADALRRGGHDVTTVTAYRTVTLRPDPDTARAADAVLFASGSAVAGWCRAFGVTASPRVIVIGPSTAAVAERLGLKVAGVAADHSLDGLVAETERQLADAGSSSPGSEVASGPVADLQESTGERESARGEERGGRT